MQLLYKKPKLDKEKSYCVLSTKLDTLQTISMML